MVLGSAMRLKSASPAVANKPGRSAAITSMARSAVCSISRNDPRSLFMPGFVALDDQRYHRFTNRFFADRTEFFLEAIQRHNSFGHGAMAAGAADIIVKPLHDLAGALDVANIAYRDHDSIIRYAGDDCPLYPFDLQAELRHLRNDILAFDFAQMNDRYALVQLEPGKRPAQGLEIFE